ncbi:MAG: ABC transporter substrate-binding protein [Methanosarcina sp.]
MKSVKHFAKFEPKKTSLKNIFKQKFVFVIIILALCANIFSAQIVSAEASQTHPGVQEEGFFERFITYIKSLYSSDENLQDTLGGSELEAMYVNQPAENKSTDSAGSMLKIATPNVIKSASLFGDTNLGIFAHLSNPPLMKMDTEGLLKGQLVESYNVSENNTLWTFYLKDDLYWSDGQKVTPKDIEFSIRYYGERTSSAAWINDTLENSEVSDAENSVTFKFNKPYTRVDLEFATYDILPAHIWETIENPMEYTDSGPYVGCGPYYLKQVDLNAGKLIFDKNTYWKGKVPAFDTVEIDFYSSVDVATLALENGDVDTYYKYAGSYPYPNIEQLKKTGNFDFLEKTNIGLIFLAPNLKKAPFSDLEFRKALSYAINYEEIIKLETLGHAQVPNYGFVPPSMENFKETEKLVYNPETAREILEEAGYKDNNGNGVLEGKDGKDISLEILIRPEYARTGELLEEYLEQVGISAGLKTMDPDTWVTLKDNYDYDLTVTRSTPWGMLMHASWGSGYFDSRRTGQGVMHNLDDPEFLQLCDDILATKDPQELQGYAYDLQDYYAGNLPAIPLYWDNMVTPFNKQFEGWYTDPLYGIYNLDNFLSIRKSAA